MNITVFVASGEPGALDCDYRSYGAKLIYGSPRFRGLVPFIECIKENKYNVVHVNAGYGSGIYCFIGWFLGVRNRISHLRSAGLPEVYMIEKLKYFLYIPLLNVFSTNVVGVSASCRNISHTRKKKWVTLYNGIKASRLVPKNKNNKKIKVALVGRQHVCKNIPFSLQVIHKLKQFSDCEINLIGKEDLRLVSELRYLEDELGIKDNVIHHGQLTSRETRHIVAQSDILLLTSTREGLPGSVLEACEIGIPVLATDLPGVLEIKEYIPSVIVKSLKEGPGEWAKTIFEISRHNKESDFGCQIRESFRGSPFTLDQHIKKLLLLWEV